jgi:hypothetical protein
MKKRYFQFLVAATILLAPSAALAYTCYLLTWIAPTTLCTGGCSGIYDICPTKVVCMPVSTPANKDFTPLVTSPVNCKSFSGGTGTCPNCIGGIPVWPPATVTVINQTCFGPCP